MGSELTFSNIDDFFNVIIAVVVKVAAEILAIDRVQTAAPWTWRTRQSLSISAGN